MKAAVNGVLNLSVLDGWWAEAYDPAVGWALDGTSDEADTEQLYRVLEEQVVPPFESRDDWVEHDEELDRDARAALFDAARGDRVHRALLPSGLGRRGTWFGV